TRPATMETVSGVLAAMSIFRSTLVSTGTEYGSDHTLVIGELPVVRSEGVEVQMVAGARGQISAMLHYREEERTGTDGTHARSEFIDDVISALRGESPETQIGMTWQQFVARVMKSAQSRASAGNIQASKSESIVVGAMNPEISFVRTLPPARNGRLGIAPAEP